MSTNNVVFILGLLFMLGWMAAQYELDESWGPGLMLYDEIRRAANL